ncbi:AraC family transcriptional regulator [Paeniglutamicibacter sp. MACA_103]|uniref:AraC family transcriptional regulator n=1 Tax=Paeniglutamicibacter sp. MACA_103 TaxID=3377337 RepID=UPI003893336B
MGENQDDVCRASVAGRGTEGEAAPSPPVSRQARQLRFSTNGIPATNRLELWENHNAKALIPLDIRTMDESPLEAREISLGYGSLRFGGVTGSAQVVERSERFIRQNPTDAIAVFFTLRGEALFYHRDGHEVIKPGQAIVCDADRPFMRGFSKGLKEMVLTIPREDYLELSGGEPLLKPRIIEFNQGAASNQQMRALAGLVSDTLSGQAGEKACPEGSVRDLLALLVSGNDGGSGAGYLAAAHSHIEDHLRDPELGTARIAAAIGISERHLSRIFAEAGEPPGAYVRERRLELARELLTDPGRQATSVGAVALQVGFASQSYFTRAFKSRYGITPLALRREALPGASR